MHTFRVWAPVAEQVRVQVQGDQFPLQRAPNGWWHGRVDSASPGADYGFLLDGEGPFPDPRSPWQPAGPHDLSRLIDPGGFAWTDAGFQPAPWSSAVLYELHTGTFTPEGTFAAASERLDHLVRLGISHVQLMPVHQFSGAHGWGYDSVDLFAPHAAYGGPDGLKLLVDACHRRGLAVLLDVVYNHLGPSGNYLAKFGPYFTDGYHTAWGAAVNFDGPESDEVRRFFCDNALSWLREYHMDGLRLDAVHAIHDRSARPFLEQLGAEIKQLQTELGRPLTVIAESDLNDPRLLWARDRGGFALDAQWSDDFHHALHAVLTGEAAGYYADFGTLAHLTRALTNAYVYDGRYSVHRRRRHGRSPGGLSGHRFLGYAQTHDQIGNRARGDRLSQMLGLDRLKIAAAIVLTSPFVPLLFMGEEWGAATPFQYFTDHAEPDLAEAVRAGRRRDFSSFGWKPSDIPDPQARATFERSKLNWHEPTKEPHATLLAWHRQLIELRRLEPDLSDGRLDRVRTHHDEAARWLVVERGSIVVVCNLHSGRQTLPLRGSPARLLLASHPEIRIVGASVSLPPDTVAILKLT